MDFARGMEEQRRRAAFPAPAVVDLPVAAFENEAEKRRGMSMARNDKSRRISILDQRDAPDEAAALPVAVIPAWGQDGEHVLISGFTGTFKSSTKVTANRVGNQ